MKTKSYLIGLLLCATAVVGLFIAKSPAQGNPHQPRSFIVIGLAERYHRGPNFEYIPDGLMVQWVEADQNAPEIKKGDFIGDTVAKCLDLGYRFEQMPGYIFILVR